MKPIAYTILQDYQFLRLGCNELTERMTHIHSQMAEVRNASYYEQLRNSTKPRRYHRNNHSGIDCPTLEDVVEELRDLNFIDAQEFSAGQLLEDRIKVWQELNQFCERIELIREEKENKLYQVEYEDKIREIDDCINGEEHVIESHWIMALSDLKLPFDLQLRMEYSKKTHSAVVDVIMPSNINMPYVKTVFHTRGSTVKNKLQKEVTQDIAEFKIGLLFLIANRTWAITPSLQYLMVKLWLPGRNFGEIAVDFERDRFVSQVFPSMTPSSQLYNWAHVSDERLVRGSIFFNQIDAQSFEQRCERLKSFRNNTPGAISPSLFMEKRTTCELSMSDALLICRTIANNEEIEEAINFSKQRSKTTVTLPVRYEGLLKEIKQDHK